MRASFARSFPLFALFLVLCASLSGTVWASVREFAVLETSKGTLELELWPDAAPQTVRNFKYLADSHYYDDTAFHRLVAGFMVQGGDPNTRDPSKSASYGTGGPGYAIPDEVSTDPARSHKRGVISMANSGPNTNGSQFFIVFGDASFLDGSYSSFGKLTDRASNETTLNTLAAEAVVQQDSSTEISKPVNRLVVQSIRIHTVVTDPDTANYKAATYTGLLRGLNRTTTMGSYTISVSSLGAFTGTVQYYGRVSRISGRFTTAENGTEATAIATLDSSTAVPLTLELGLRLASSSGQGINALSVQITDANLAATDRATTTATGSAETLSGTLLADRYTVLMERPLNGTQAALANLLGYGALGLSVKRATGAVTLVGKFADGTAYTASKVLTNENGHFLFPLYDTKWRSDLESARASFANFALGLWDGYLNAPANFLFQLRGTIEVPKSAPGTPIFSSLIWFRNAKTTGSIRSAVAGYSTVVTAPWTPPARGTTLATFSSDSPRGLLQIGGIDALEFTLNKNNSAGVFARGPLSPTLSINLASGMFSGNYRETSGNTRITRSFSGVLVPVALSTGTISGFGCLLDSTSSRAVTLTPIVP